MKTRIFSVLLFLFIPALIVRAQWIQTDGPYGRMEVDHLFASSGILIAGAQGGLFSRAESEERWSFHHPVPFISHASDGNDLYIGTYYDGIFKISLENPDDPPVSVGTFTADGLLHTGDLLVAGNDGYGIFKSMNGGVTWDFVNTGLPLDSIFNPWTGEWMYLTHVYCLATSGQHVFCGTGDGVFRTSMDVQSWEAVNIGIPALEISALFAAGESLYAVIDNMLFKSTDEGANWTQIYASESDISCVATMNDTSYISTKGDGILYSADETVWSTLNNGLPTLNVNQVVPFNGQLYCGTEGEGVFIHDDGQWVEDNPGLIISDTWSLTVCNGQVFANDYSGVYRLETNGQWTDITPAVDYELFAMVITMDDRVFLSVEYDAPYDAPFILYTDDSGETWQDLVSQPPFAGDDPYTIYADNGRLYARENELMYYTEDLGASWLDMSLPGQFCNYFYAFLVFNGTPFAAACGDVELVKYTPGPGWSLSNNGLSGNSYIQSLASCEDVLFTYLSYDGMYASFNNGDSWQPAGAGLEPGYGIRDFASCPTKLFVSSSNGIFLTSNNGALWVPHNVGLKNTNTTGLVIHNDTLYTGTFSNGVWKIALDDFPSGVPSHTDNVGGLLVIPNPATDRIAIAAEGIRAGSVKICTVTGDVVMEFNYQPGAEYNTSALARGYYLLILQTGEDYRVSKFMVW